MADERIVKIDLGELSKPATVLIEKISDAIGGFARPWQMVRVAYAHAEVDQIRAVSDAAVADITQRALSRFLLEEGRRQSNMETIAQQALLDVREDARPDAVDQDWITNFFDKARDASDADMQRLWSGILSGQANRPGAFSRRTVNLVGDLEKSDCELFTALCRFAVRIDDMTPLVFDVRDEFYVGEGVNFSSMTQLEALGLIRLDTWSGFEKIEMPRRQVVLYHDDSLELDFGYDEGNELTVGVVMFTRAGHELFPLCHAPAIPGLLDYAKKHWADHGIVAKRKSAARNGA